MTMSKKRIQYSSKFKGKLVLTAIRGDETVSQLAARYNIYPTQINNWKRQLIEQDAELFYKNNTAANKGLSTTDDLHRLIGQLTVERDFLMRQLNH
jgi:transposase